MTKISVEKAITTARQSVSPLCEVYQQGGGKQWQYFWTSRRGREQSYPTEYARARKARSATIAGIAAEIYAKAHGHNSPHEFVFYAEFRVHEHGDRIDSAVRRCFKG
jgi:hypothetical protein